VREPGFSRRRQRLAEAGDQPARQRGGSAHAHLLAEHGAHRQLEPVPGAGHAKTRACPDSLSQLRAARELAADALRIRIQIEQPPHARHHRLEVAQRGEAQHQPHAVAGRGDGERAGRRAQRAPAAALVHHFDAWRRAQPGAVQRSSREPVNAGSPRPARFAGAPQRFRPQSRAEVESRASPG
jgi:hypothetical protein